MLSKAEDKKPVPTKIFATRGDAGRMEPVVARYLYFCSHQFLLLEIWEFCIGGRGEAKGRTNKALECPTSLGKKKRRSGFHHHTSLREDESDFCFFIGDADGHLEGHCEGHCYAYLCSCFR